MSAACQLLELVRIQGPLGEVAFAEESEEGPLLAPDYRYPWLEEEHCRTRKA
jgi:hypothetical protein